MWRNQRHGSVIKLEIWPRFDVKIEDLGKYIGEKHY